MTSVTMWSSMQLFWYSNKVITAILWNQQIYVRRFNKKLQEKTNIQKTKNKQTYKKKQNKKTKQKNKNKHKHVMLHETELWD